VPAVDFDRTIGLMINRIRHQHADGVVLVQDLGFDDPGNGLKTHFFFCYSMAIGKSRGTSGAIAAHLGDRTVGIVELPFEIGNLAVFNQDQAIGADGEFAPTDPAREIRLRCRGKQRTAMIDDDEVIAGTAHFGEGQRKHAHFDV